MTLNDIQQLFNTYKETKLYGRYITNSHIEPLLHRFKEKSAVRVLGHSVLHQPIYGIKIGGGSKRLLLWSQMHGNESTTTKAIFDLLNTLMSDSDLAKEVLDTCTLYIIPILNPDGAERYTRINANEIDLNRDAQDLSQPESQILRQVFNDFKPDFCFNLHGQRTIFSAGKVNKPAIVSFLAPAQDQKCTVTLNRKKAMEIIGVMNSVLQELIPEQVGVYDDSFNINCVGDTFQHFNIPTILFEAGHAKHDYARENTRELIYIAYITALKHIMSSEVTGDGHESYFDIPENAKCFFDVIIRNASSEGKILDIAFQFEERLIDGAINFIPIVQKMEDLAGFYGHKEWDANGGEVLTPDGSPMQCFNENVFVIMNNEKISLFTE